MKQLSIFLAFFPFLLATAMAQPLKPDPAPKFRWSIPIPKVEGKQVKTATVVDYDRWREDSLAKTTATKLILRKTSAELVEFQFDRGGKLTHALRIYEEGGELDADWEESYTYDEAGHLTEERANFVSHEDGEKFARETSSYRYDKLGRLVEDLRVGRPSIFGTDTIDNIWRKRYQYSPDGKSGSRELCIIKKLAIGDMSCRIASLTFREDGSLLEITPKDETDPGKAAQVETAFTYDSKGRLVKKVEYAYGAEAFVYSYTWDDQDRIQKVIFADKRNKMNFESVEYYQYRPDGLLERVSKWGSWAGADRGDYKILYEFF